MRYQHMMMAGLLLLSGLAFAAGPLTGHAGKFTVELTCPPAPLKVGENQLSIVVKDGGKPLTGAAVDVHLDMVEMPMPADIKTTPGAKGGEYLAKANLGMAGKWKVTVSVRQMADMTMDGDGKADFELMVGKVAQNTDSQTAPVSTPPPASPGYSKPRWEWLGAGLLIILVAIIIIAISNRRKVQ